MSPLLGIAGGLVLLMALAGAVFGVLAAMATARFLHRMPTRAAAIRELLKLGLAASGSPIADGSKSSNYGVLGRGPNSHAEGDET